MRLVKERRSLITLPWWKNFWISTSHSLANMAEKMKTLTCMTSMCMIALRNKTVAHTFLPSFGNTNGRLYQERLLRSRNFATMVTWHYTSPLYCFILCVCLWLKQAGFQMMARNEIVRGVTLPAELTVSFMWLNLGYSRKTLQESQKRDFELSNIFVEHALHVAWIQFSTQVK